MAPNVVQLFYENENAGLIAQFERHGTRVRDAYGCIMDVLMNFHFGLS
jgi:hypothetical protein